MDPYAENPDPPEDVAGDAMEDALCLLQEAVDYEGDVWRMDEDINGGDLVEWFGDWRVRVLAILNRIEEVPKA
jgi:hypothetical protein